MWHPCMIMPINSGAKNWDTETKDFDNGINQQETEKNNFNEMYINNHNTSTNWTCPIQK